MANLVFPLVCHFLVSVMFVRCSKQQIGIVGPIN